MTSQDNLRDRMADAMYLADADEVMPMPYQTVEFSHLPPHEKRAYRRSAQAIIDEFGMTMETNAAVEGPRHMRRVIGEWEWA